MSSSDPALARWRARGRGVPSPVGRRCLGAEQVQQQLCRDRFSVFAVSSFKRILAAVWAVTNQITRRLRRRYPLPLLPAPGGVFREQHMNCYMSYKIAGCW